MQTLLFIPGKGKAAGLGRFRFVRGRFRNQLCNFGEKLLRRHAFGEYTVCHLVSRRQVHQSREENDGDFWLQLLYLGDKFCAGKVRQ